MIIFIGSEDRGYWIKETAGIRKEPLQFVSASITIKQQINDILKCSGDYMIFDIEQYVDGAKELAEEIKQIERAKNTEVIIYAPGYDRESKIIKELMFQGMKYFVYSGNYTEAREELERCLSGYYKDPEELQEAEKPEEQKQGKKIGITGACSRIGTTTFALQFVKYLQLKGHKACYLEVNSTNFVLQHEYAFNIANPNHDEYLGKLTFEGIDMYYKQQNLVEVLKQDYDYFIFDFGTYLDTNFNKTSFLEKDVRVFVMGSKASEMSATNEVIRNEYYSDVEYVFNFISEREKPELLEYMEERAARTYFTRYTPDPFEYVPNPIFDQIFPVEDLNQPQEEKEKKPRFGWWKK